MMTLQFLKNTQNFKAAIPQPAKFTPNGYYPTMQSQKQGQVNTPDAKLTVNEKPSTKKENNISGDKEKPVQKKGPDRK